MFDRRMYLWFPFALAALVGIAFFFIPAFIIRPFAHQSSAGLSVAMALRQRAPLPTFIAAILCLILGLILWNASRRAGKIIVASLMALVAFSAVMSRLNYFEWMFHPVDSARFEPASASKLDKGEMVLAIRYGSDARAYPIREMAYHHILNDVVGDVPVAVTY